MSRSKRMEPVKQLRQQQEIKAAGNLSQAQQRYQEARQRLEELKVYKNEYLSEFSHKAQKGMSGSQLQHYKTFLGQIDNAINQQQQQTDKLNFELGEQRKSWQSKHAKTQAISRYQQKMQTQENQRLEAAQQKTTEDYFNGRPGVQKPQ